MISSEKKKERGLVLKTLEMARKLAADIVVTTFSKTYGSRSTRREKGEETRVLDRVKKKKKGATNKVP